MLEYLLRTLVILFFGLQPPPLIDTLGLLELIGVILLVLLIILIILRLISAVRFFKRMYSSPKPISM